MALLLTWESFEKDQFVIMNLNEEGKQKYKLTAVIAERKKVMTEFLSTCSKIKQCEHCGS